MGLNSQNTMLVAFLVVVVLIGYSASSPNKNEKLEKLEARLDHLQAKVEFLEAKNTENEAKIKRQDEEITTLKAIMNSKVDEPDNKKPAPLANNFNIKTNSRNGVLSSLSRVLPSSCRELSQIGHSLDGIYLVRNQDTRKIETIFCEFATSISQIFIGNVDIKTKNVHFFVTRTESFDGNGAIPFEKEYLNIGGAMNITTGFFTVPVNGTYHFEFTGYKDTPDADLTICLQVNGPSAGFFGTSVASGPAGKYTSLYLTVSLQLKASDQVSIFKFPGGVLFEPGASFTQFTGWLVEEDL